MRVLILANNDVGLYKFRKELIEKLLNQHHEVFISLPDGDMVRPLEKIGCRFIDTPVDRRGINPKADIKLFNNYRKIISEINPELVITYTIKPNIYGGIAARFAKKQYAVNITGLGTAFENPGMVKTIVINLYKIALKKAKVIFFENSSNRDELLSLNCCRLERTVILNGAGVNTEYYNYQPYPNNDKVKFLFVGRVMKEKGVDELFEAMKRIFAEGAKTFLDVVGPFEEDYKEKLAKYQSEGWLMYHGYQKDVRPFIKDCDCFVLASYHEGMANTNLECASSGRPIITSNIPGCREAVLNGKSGYLCEPKNIESLYQAMRRIIQLKKEDREKMGIEGRALMVQQFEKRAVVERTINSIME